MSTLLNFVILQPSPKVPKLHIKSLQYTKLSKIAYTKMYE